MRHRVASSSSALLLIAASPGWLGRSGVAEGAPLAVGWAEAGCTLRNTSWNSAGVSAHIGLVLQCSGLDLVDIPLLTRLDDQVVALDFSGNSVAVLGPASLAELADHPAGAGVVTLSAAHNRITAVLPGALAPLPNLETLDLGHNRLGQLAGAMFPAGNSIRSVDLRLNRILTVEAGLPTALAAMTMLRMAGNPAACSLAPSATRVLACRCPGDPDATAADAASDGRRPEPSKTFCPPEANSERTGCQVQTSKLGTVMVDCRGLGYEQFPTTAEVPAGVTELLLSNNAIRDIGPGALSRFPKLKNLFIDQNEVGHVEPGELSNLVELEMDGNPSTCKWTTPRWKGVRCHCAAGFAGNGTFCIPQRAVTDACQVMTPRDADGAESSFVIVDCTGQELRAVPSGIPASTTTLLLGGNAIQHIATDDLAGLAALTSLSFVNNAVQSISPRWLQSAPKLETLDMIGNPSTCVLDPGGAVACSCAAGFSPSEDGCKLVSFAADVCTKSAVGAGGAVPDATTIAPVAGNGGGGGGGGGDREPGKAVVYDCYGRDLERVPTGLASSTTSLVLSDNQIAAVTRAEFDAVPFITELLLAYNRLTTIVDGTFRGLPLLTKLDLSYNRLQAFTAAGFGESEAIMAGLNLAGNPSTCAVDLEGRLEGGLAGCTCAANHAGDGTFCRPRPNAEHHCDRRMVDGAELSIDCSGKDFDLAPYNIPPETKHLTLEGNAIRWLPAELLAGLPELEVLVLGGNPLAELRSGMFKAQQKLRVLDLQVDVADVTPDVTPDVLVELPYFTEIFLPSDTVPVTGDAADDPCPKGPSRDATFGINEALAPLLESENGTRMRTTLGCPLNTFLHAHHRQEERKHAGTSRYTCGFCGKAFRTERTLDDHFDRRHADTRPGHAVLCPAHLCDIFGCDCSPDCDAGTEKRVQAKCIDLARRCSSGDVLFEYLNATLCSNVTCTGIRKLCESPPGWGWRTVLGGTLLVFGVAIVLMLGVYVFCD